MKKNNYFLKSYKNLKVLITGSTGFKGAWLANWLIMLGAKVVGVGLRPERDSIIFSSLELNKRIKQYFVDIKKFSKINSIIKKEKPDIIFHLAAQSIVSLSYKNPLETFETNIIGSGNILELISSLEKQDLKGISLITLVDDSCFTTDSFANWLWVTFTRSNPAYDIYGINSIIENKHFSCSIPIIDSRIKPHHAPVLER